MTPDAFRARLDRFFDWLAGRAEAVGLDRDQRRLFEETLRRATDERILIEWEPRQVLRHLLEAPGGNADRLLDLAVEREVPEVLVRNARASICEPILGVLARSTDPADGPDTFFVPRLLRWRRTGTIRYRLWSFWSDDSDDDGRGMRLCGAPPAHMNLRFGESGIEADEAAAWIDLGDRVLDALERPGWETLRLDQLALCAHRVDAPSADPSETIDRLRAYRQRMREEYHFLPGLNEGALLVGRLEHLLGPGIGPEALGGSSNHPDDEIGLSIQLEIDDGQRVRHAWADQDEHGESGIPSLETVVDESGMETTRAVLSQVVDDLLAEPVLADVPVGLVGPLGVAAGRIVRGDRGETIVNRR